MELRTLFGRGTQQQYAELMAFQTGPGGRLQKDVGRMALALTPDQAVAAAAGNLATNMQSLNTQVERLTTNLGAPAAHAVGGVVSKMFLPIAHKGADFVGAHPKAAAATDIGIVGTVLGLGAWGVSKIMPLAKAVGGQVAKLLKAGGSAVGAEGGEVAAVARSAGLLARVAPVLEAIGAGISALVAAVVEAPVALIVAATAAIGGLFIGIYEAAKHWQANKGVVENFKAEWSGLIDFVVGEAKKLPNLHLGGSPPIAGSLQATIPVSIGGKHVETIAVQAATRAVTHGLKNSTRNSDPRVTQPLSGSVMQGAF